MPVLELPVLLTAAVGLPIVTGVTMSYLSAKLAVVSSERALNRSGAVDG